MMKTRDEVKLASRNTVGESALLDPSAENGRAVKRGQRRAQLADELAMEIDGLRGSLAEMLERFRLKLEAELVELSSAARGESRVEGRTRKLPASVAQKMLAEIRAVEIKPKKGRAKDFQRLQNLVGELSEILPPEK